MDKSEILKLFLSKGYQLNGDALEYFEKNLEKTKKFLDMEDSEKLKGITITKEIIENKLSSLKEDEEIVRNFNSKETKIIVGEMINIFLNRYKKTSEIILKNKDLENIISINRISQQNKKFSLIGMLSEVNPGDKSLVVEDMTGSVPVYIVDQAEGDFNYLVEDEVVGIICDNDDGSENRAVKIIFPDIPFKSKPTTSKEDILCIFLEEFSEEVLQKIKTHIEKTSKIVIFTKNIQPPQKLPENVEVRPLKEYPVILTIGGVRILISNKKSTEEYFQKFRTSPENMMLQLLKKRHLDPIFKKEGKISQKQAFLEEEDIPDIVVVEGYGDPKNMNYKGTTFLSLGDSKNPTFWAVNLTTRETIKINLT